MKTHRIFFLALLVAALSAQAADNKDSSPTPSGDTSTAATPTPGSKPVNQTIGTTKALVVHKPMPSPSWGRVIQYHKVENFVLSDNNRETLYEFLFQDDAGIVRTAVYHENPSGDGYWEVEVWDQP